MARLISPRRRRRPNTLRIIAEVESSGASSPPAKLQLPIDENMVIGYEGNVANRRLRSTSNSSSSRFSKYFMIFFAMTLVQALGIIMFGLVSTSLHNGSLFGPMEVFMMSHLWITTTTTHHHHHHRHHNMRDNWDSPSRHGHHEDEDDHHFRFTDIDNVDYNDENDETMLDVEDSSSTTATNSTGEAFFDLAAATMNDTSALDDYYRRPHIVPSLQRRPAQGPPPILIVGGSDGSGTRAFVDTLRRLGVPMLIDDTSTLDVHAPNLFSDIYPDDERKRGWPPLVQMILEQTHSADYDLDGLPESVRETALAELRKFQMSYAPRVKEMLKNASATSAITSPRTNATLGVAAHVQYGFKAPVSMLLLPLLLETFGRVKFLHVVRDGRDVSFSRNTSPVAKFYEQYYSDPKVKSDEIVRCVDTLSDASKVQAMQLWNDWNSQVWEWSNRNADGNTFDFLVMRTEDLVNPVTKFESLFKLADFVGSPLTKDDLCCLSQQELVDMGQSMGGGKKRARRHGYPDMYEAERNWNEEDKLRHRGGVNVDELDDPTEITMVDIAMESERQALDSVLQKRPEIFKRIQAAREQNQERMRLRRSNDHARQGGGRNGGRRRLSEDKERRSFLSVVRKEALQKVRKEHKKQGPLKVLNRYGKWKSALEGRPKLSNALHSEGKVALKLFGYQPPRRYSDRPTDETKLVCNAHCPGNPQDA